VESRTGKKCDNLTDRGSDCLSSCAAYFQQTTRNGGMNTSAFIHKSFV